MYTYMSYGKLRMEQWWNDVLYKLIKKHIRYKRELLNQLIYGILIDFYLFLYRE